jgi:hypothetical protein
VSETLKKELFMKKVDSIKKGRRKLKREVSKVCERFGKCAAPLCPLDENMDKRCWYADEKVCQSRIHGNIRWVKKQKSIVKRKINKWSNRPVTYQELYDVSGPRKI